MQWRLPSSAAIPGLGDVDREALGIPSEAEYVRRYCERRGIDAIPDLEFYLAFSFFRLAAIMQGIVKRAQIGTASSSDAHSSTEGVIGLAELGKSLTD